MPTRQRRVLSRATTRGAASDDSVSVNDQISTDSYTFYGDIGDIQNTQLCTTTIEI